MSLAKATSKRAVAAARRAFDVDGQLYISDRDRSKFLKRGGSDTHLTQKLADQWPVSQRQDRQLLTLHMAEQQSSRHTFNRDYYHYTYEQYLGKSTKFADAYPLVQQRQLHWTDLLLCSDAPPLTDLKHLLRQVGVNPEFSIEDYNTWLVGLAHIANKRPFEWPAIDGELSSLMHTWIPGTMSDRYALAVVVLAQGFEMRRCVELLSHMRMESMLFTDRAYQLLSSPGSTAYDIINGHATTPATATGFAKLTEACASQGAGFHGLLVYAMRRRRSSMFWWCVRLYAEHRTGLGQLSSETIALVVFAWMHSHETLHPATVSAIIEMFAWHGLPKHCASVASEYAGRMQVHADMKARKKRTRVRAAPPLQLDTAALMQVLQQSQTVTPPEVRACEAALRQVVEGGGGAVPEEGAGEGGEGKEGAAAASPVPSDGGASPTPAAVAVRGVEGGLSMHERHMSALQVQRPTSRRRTKVEPIPREKVEAACVRELLRNAPFGGDQMVHKYITISNL